MTEFGNITVAAVQAAPQWFDSAASTVKACSLINEAAAGGAQLAAFGETWLPGYPFFAGERDSPLVRRARAEYLANAIEIPGPETDALCSAAREAGIDVVIGVVELDSTTRSTCYCTLLFIDSSGEIMSRHRKLKPTGAGRTVWGEGDGVGLTVHQRDYGRISGLNCFEHIMMLPGYALAAQGTQIHVSAWPTVDSSSKGELLSRAFAVQAGCYVVAVGTLRTTESVPERFAELHESGWTFSGNSCIVDPEGEVVARAEGGVETILLHDISMESVYAAKVGRDIGGHYSRPDILSLNVNRKPLFRLREGDDSPEPDNPDVEDGVD